MNDPTLLGDWLDTLSRKYGLGSLAPDPSGLSVLRYGQALDVMIECPPGARDLLVQIPLMPIPSTDRERFFRQLLALNHRGEATRGATLGLNEASQTVMLAVQAPLAHLDALGFEHLIGNLIDCAESLLARLAMLPAEEAGPVGADPEAGLRSLIKG